ncbi:DUF4411 family protein [Paenibacillus sp. CGMCC 1.16610]|uniref:DUF4411 family protein n=1 Tax=Paenibacillus anseongense TaxID=2682845 RepID=A0ABW9U2Z1_9BACL|nr:MULTISPECIES: DUF4411 family protein [Paenibacillus]MBA2937089.1 DUF4411 family protein [Paenibacillus sp. CGMCC 1.16610]MVQ33411.1 DUF4411 family protein [Paenibacillus anseongense]
MSPPETIIYHPDTNLFCYLINDAKDQQDYRKSATEFWEKVLLEATQKTAKIVISKEVERELRVQMQTLKEKKRKIIEEILETNSNRIDQSFSMDLETELRIFSNFIRSEPIRPLLNIPGYKFKDYPKVSDIRILVDALMNEAVLATGNIKDFIMYPLFLDEPEDKLYDIINKKFVNLPPEFVKAVKKDTKLHSIIDKLGRLQR